MDTAQAAQVTQGNARHKRRALPIVDARFQWKYTLIITALGVGVAAIMGGFLYKAHVDNTRRVELFGDATLHAELIKGDQIFLLYIIALVVVMAVALAFWGLVVTHRISGPLHILGRYLSVLADGRYPDLRPLRKRDELHEFFTAFEEAVTSLRNRDLAALKDIDELISRAKKGASGDDIARSLERYREVLVESLGDPNAK